MFGQTDFAMKKRAHVLISKHIGLSGLEIGVNNSKPIFSALSRSRFHLDSSEFFLFENGAFGALPPFVGGAKELAPSRQGLRGAYSPEGPRR